ncbi:sugar ABC transporter permease [Brachyspira sp. G79]|uniref:carbohydrate ABC transporter permease n=1 Tax=Brachyspira sp. G79 TaxID=1358104 RepID=UPI000BBCAEBB|nr:sugar ABC transporter permease [Brachyspira sp. G79]PCG20301.1 sugar ABC transporter permease [Brachyspira sp. G79]
MYKKYRKITAVIFVFPAIIVFLIAFLYPVFRTGIMSLFYVETISDSILNWKFVGIDNFVFLFKSSLFLKSLKNVFIIWLIGGLIVFSISLFFASILTFSNMKFKSFFKTLIYLPNIISSVALATMWIYYFYQPDYGFLKSFFTLVGLQQLANIKWASPDYVFMSMLIAYSFSNVGYFMVMFCASMESIPSALYDSASIDGANSFDKFFKITLPLILNAIKSAIVIWSIEAFGMFVWSQIFSPLDPEPGTITPKIYMYFQLFGSNLIVSERNAGLGASICVILSVIALFSFLLVNLFFRGNNK